MAEFRFGLLEDASPLFGSAAAWPAATSPHAGEAVPPEAKVDLEDLAQQLLRNPFSVEKMTLESLGDIVIYRSRLNAKMNRNFEVLPPPDFLAAITQHIPDKGAQMVRGLPRVPLKRARAAC